MPPHKWNETAIYCDESKQDCKHCAIKSLGYESIEWYDPEKEGVYGYCQMPWSIKKLKAQGIKKPKTAKPLSESLTMLCNSRRRKKS